MIVVLYIALALVQAAVTPFCPCGEQARVVLNIPDRGAWSLRVGCTRDVWQRLYFESEDPWGPPT